MDEIFDSEVCSSGEFAGVFEYDGETSFFYLYKMGKSGNAQVLDAIRVCAGTPDFSTADIKISWDTSEKIVGLLIRGEVWAAFELNPRQKFDGAYSAHGVSKVPEGVVQKLILNG